MAKSTIMNLAHKMKKVMQGVKVVDKIDIDSIPNSFRPDALNRTEKNENRKYMMGLHELRDKIHNVELQIAELEKKYDEDDLCKKASERKRKQLRKDFLEKRMEVRKKYENFDLSNNDRQKMFRFQGIRPQYMDVVHFHCMKAHSGQEPYDGLALARDENHYYIAVDLYPHSEQEDNITTCLDENPDNTFEGIWPSDICLSKPSKFEERMMRMLVDKYADDIQKAKEYVAGAQQRDLDESTALSKEIHDLTTALDAYGNIDAQLQEKRGMLSDLKEKMDAMIQKHDSNKDANKHAETTDSVDAESAVDVVELTEYEKRFPHLPYLRGKRNLEDMTYPFIDTKYRSWLRFRLMANVARLFEKVASWKPLTYVLSDEYMDELKSRAKRAYHGLSATDVVPEGEKACGVIVFRHQRHEDTIVYDFNNISQLSITVTYIREGTLLFYESYSEQQVLGRPRIDSYICESMRNSGTDANRLYAYVRNIIISFLAMERDIERTMKAMVEEGRGEEETLKIKPEGTLRTDINEDVVIRDANWYSSISIDHLIPVQGYVSHRWCGKGKEKYLKQVWVRPHERNGYHREAGVTKTVNNNEILNTIWE